MRVKVGPGAWQEHGPGYGHVQGATSGGTGGVPVGQMVPFLAPIAPIAPRSREHAPALGLCPRGHDGRIRDSRGRPRCMTCELAAQRIRRAAAR